MSIENGEVSHSGLFIRYLATNHFFHFDSKKVLLIEIPIGIDYCFFKQLDFIPDELIPSIYNYFKIVEKTANPTYGYFYTGSFYDSSSYEFIDEHSMPEIMSCVGFCLNVLKTILRQNDFIKYIDWHFHNGITEDDVLRYFEKSVKNFPNIDLAEFTKHVRRILPIEYYTAGFSHTIPVEKSFTDLYIKDVKKSLLSKA